MGVEKPWFEVEHSQAARLYDEIPQFDAPRERSTDLSEAAPPQVMAGDHETYLNRTGEGNAEAVLFLHGSGPGASAWSNWQFALPALGERFDCLAPDLVGYGKSEHPTEPPAETGAWLDVWLDQLTGLLDALGVEKAHLVGNSMGGALALHLADRHPERIGRIALMGSMGVPFQITTELDALWGFYDEPSPERMAEVINWFVYDPATVGGDVDAIARERYGGATRPEIGRSFAAMFPGPDRQRHVDALALSKEAIGRVENPALLVHGRDDVIIPLETSLRLLRDLQRPQMHVFGRCRHWIMIEHRKSFNRLLESFLAGEV